MAGEAVSAEEPIIPTPIPGKEGELNQESPKTAAGELAFKSPSTPNPLICVGVEQVDCAHELVMVAKNTTNANTGNCRKDENAGLDDNRFIMQFRWLGVKSGFNSTQYNGCFTEALNQGYS